MINEEKIIEPEFYCPVCHQKMSVIFYDNKDAAMDLVEGTCPNDHKTVLRIKKNAANDVIIDQFHYVVESKGGDVIYKD